MKKKTRPADEIKKEITGKDRIKNLRKAVIYKEILDRPKHRRSR